MAWYQKRAKIIAFYVRNLFCGSIDCQHKILTAPNDIGNWVLFIVEKAVFLLRHPSQIAAIILNLIFLPPGRRIMNRSGNTLKSIRCYVAHRVHDPDIRQLGTACKGFRFNFGNLGGHHKAGYSRIFECAVFDYILFIWKIDSL